MQQGLISPNGYILVFVTGDRRENFDAVLQVFDMLVARGLREHLVLAGTRGDQAQALQAQADAFPWGKRVRILPFFGEAQALELARIYAGASVYLDLSLHEGFGMQVIEAMACGTPVVCSNRGALPEVAGAAALLVDPEDITQIADAVCRVLTEDSSAQTCKSLGARRRRAIRGRGLPPRSCLPFKPDLSPYLWNGSRNSITARPGFTASRTPSQNVSLRMIAPGWCRCGQVHSGAWSWN